MHCARSLKNWWRKFKIWSWDSFLGMFLIKMNLIFSNHSKHKKRHLAIIEMLNVFWHMTNYVLCFKNCLSKFKIWSCNMFAGVFWFKMNFIASNYDEHRKDIEQLWKHQFFLIHDLFSPSPKKLIDQIQNLTLQCICRHVLIKNELDSF